MLRVPSSVRQIFAAADLEPDGVVAWGTPVPQRRPGVYMVALTERSDQADATLAQCPVDSSQLEALLDVRPELQLDTRRPSVKELAERLSAFWLPDETIVYIGLTSRSMRTRVGQYYRTRLGATKPHAGGWWLKTLTVLPQLWVHYAATEDYGNAEDEMLRCFACGVSDRGRAGLHDRDRVMPFANLKDADDLIKVHGIKGATGELPR